MYDTQIISDNDSIDFAFFDTEGDHIKLYEGGGKHSSCSKIITQAVIESNNSDRKNIEPTCKEKLKHYTHTEAHDSINTNSEVVKYHWAAKEVLGERTIFEEVDSFCGNIHGSDVDNSLFNCLAYNNSLQTKATNEHVYCDDKEYSSNSSSESNSTITTITSDLTSISPLSFLSNSTNCSLFEDSTNSSEFKNDLRCNDGATDDSCEEIEKSINEFKEIEEGTNDRSCTNSKTSNEYEDYSNPDELSSKNGTENEEQFNYENDDETHNIVDENSLSEKDIKTPEEHSYSETWESGSESGDRPHTNAEYDLSFQKSFQRNDSEIGSWDLENEIQNVSLEERQVNSSQEEHSTFSRSSSGKTQAHRKQGKSKRKKGLNLTFSREELIKIERDNLILLKKIMSQSKPRTMSTNQLFTTKKTSTAINRAKHQKQIDQDNYILYSKINAMNRTKKVF